METYSAISRSFMFEALAQISLPEKIPLDRELIYFLYVGRRIPIKGYDYIIEAFSRAFSKRKEIRLLLCGGGVSLPQKGVIDLGSQKKIHDWIFSVDCVVNANRQSYFDLSVMETLSVGKTLAYTATGGHKELLEFRSPGLFPY